MSSVAGVACGLLWSLAALSCGNDGADLFAPIAPSPPEGAPGGVPGAAPEIAAMDPALPALPAGAASSASTSEAGPSGALPVDPSAPSAASGAVPAAAGETESDPVVEVNPARVCPAIAEPLLLDFAQSTSGNEQALFGDFSQLLSGGTFVYPASSGSVASGADADASAAAGGVLALGLVSDVSAGDWHISGHVVEAAGFGLFFNCQLIDASGFAGVGFRMRGSVGLGNAVTLRVRTAGNEVAREWFIETGNGSPATFGRCRPESSQYDGSCDPARLDVSLSAQDTDVVVRFAELGGGRPEGGVNPAEITQLEWALPELLPSDAGVVAGYDVDLHIDDIRFVP